MRRLLPLLLLILSPAVDAEDRRATPLVKAVQLARECVVNIHSEKKAAAKSETVFSSGADRKVSGMGTGIVIDERGYIVTNHHVVKDVDALEVSLANGNRYRARVLSVDAAKDLAVIKIDPRTRLKVMPIGTSSDLMLAETVFAVGNAFGYEHTVTAGIVSALSRDVEVNETQAYYNLIQTDASINPGNSGGPLLNLNGEVVGINVAIRAGAQRIGFAIPIDDARETIAKLISPERLFGISSGIETRLVRGGRTAQVMVESAPTGLVRGDQIRRVGGLSVVDQVDMARALIGRRVGDQVPVEVLRDGTAVTVNVSLKRANSRQLAAKVTPTRTVSLPKRPVVGDRAWQILGVRLVPINAAERRQLAGRYRGGMKVTKVRAGGPAAQKGIRSGDYLVGLHIWETLDNNDMAYCLADRQIRRHNPMTYYVVRSGKTIFGQLAL